MAKPLSVILTVVLLSLAAALIVNLPTTVIAKDGQKSTQPNEIKPLSDAAQGFMEEEKERRKKGEIGLLEGYIKSLNEREVSLPGDIRRSEFAVKNLKGGLIGSQVPYEEKAPWWFPHNEWIVYDYPSSTYRMFEKWRPAYERHLNKIRKFDFTLWELWQWLIPHEEAYLKDLRESLAEIPRLREQMQEKLARQREQLKELVLENSRSRTARERLNEEEVTVDDQTVEDKGTARNLDSNTPRISEDNANQTAQENNNYLVDDELNRTEITKKDPAKPEEGQIIDAGGNGMLAGKNVKLSHLEGCGNTITGFSGEKEMGLQSTPCPGFVDGLVATPGDYSAHCERFGDPDRSCAPPPGSKVKFLDRFLEGDVPVFKTESFHKGIDGTPLSFFCHLLHYGLVKSNDNDQIMMNFTNGGLHPVYKYDNSNQKLECFYLSKKQTKSLYAEFKNIKEAPAEAKPEPEKNPPTSASSENVDDGVTTTSVQNPDGTRTVTKTDKDGNILSEEIVGKSPASASSTDNKTGITTTSVLNPDGTRTVTRTDKKGNVLSKETVGNSPASASSTVDKIGITTTSVKNPDGSRTVTKTDKDGNILSREKVR